MTSNRTPVVETKHGKVKGVSVRNVDGGEFLAFEGIPFAKPPIGPLRFKDPQPLEDWSGIRDLHDAVPKASQYDFLQKCCIGTEDCLYLNVATTSLDGKRAVMVWIHGGAFAISTSSFKLNGPDYLLKQDVVFVSINYRLGCFGFLNLGLPEASGNQGMKDMVAGLNWVQENIEAFGGDANNVTIFGESAGSAAVHLLAMSPLTKGLYHKVIAQSNVSINACTFSENSVEVGLRLAAVLDNNSINDAVDALEILLEAPQNELIKAQAQMNLRRKSIEWMVDFLPCVDSESINPFLLEHPREMCKRGINVPMIIGSTSQEGITFLVGRNIDVAYRGLNDHFAVILAELLGIDDMDRLEKIVDPVKKFYFGETSNITSVENSGDFGRLIGDTSFYNGIQQIIEIQSKLSTTTYVYQFSYIPAYPTLRKVMGNNIRGVGHGDELGALFHSSVYTGNNGLRKGTMDYLVKDRLTRMWANFAKTGNPTVKLDEIVTVRWEPITEDKLNYLEIHETLIPSVNFGEARWKFWKPILETI